MACVNDFLKRFEWSRGRIGGSFRVLCEENTILKGVEAGLVTRLGFDLRKILF